MTHKTAIPKLTHAIDYLKRVHDLPGSCIRVDGHSIRTGFPYFHGQRNSVEDALTLLGKAQCETVREMLTTSHPDTFLDYVHSGRSRA